MLWIDGGLGWVWIGLDWVGFEFCLDWVSVARFWLLGFDLTRFRLLGLLGFGWVPFGFLAARFAHL